MSLDIQHVNLQARNLFFDFRLFTKVTSTQIIFLLNDISGETQAATEHNVQLTTAKYCVSIRSICLLNCSEKFYSQGWIRKR